MKTTFKLLSQSVEVIETYLSEAYFPLRVKPVEKHSVYGMTGSTADLGDVMICWSRKIGSIEIGQVGDGEAYNLNIIKSGAATYRSSRSEIHVSENSAIVQKADWSGIAWHGSEYCTVTIAKNAVQRRLLELLDGASPGDITLKDGPVSGRSLAQFFSFMNSLETSPLMDLAVQMNHRSDSVRNVILDALIWNYPNSHIERLSKRVATLAPRHVKRALDYIHSSPQTYHTPEFLASLSSVSLRSLQYSFRDFVGQTITEYQNKVRLEHAYKDMVANPDTSLTEISLKWGFGSLSSFSRSFKRAYGQTASSVPRGTRKYRPC